MSLRLRGPARLLLASLAVALVGCDPIAVVTPSPTKAPGVNGSPAPAPVAHWPAPPNAMALAVEAGLVPEPAEQLAFHVHAHLDVFIDGKPVIVPAGIGINIDDPEVKTFENPLQYGGIQLCAQPCISPLHTHAESGILHTESATPKPNTLGQFFTEWAVVLSDTCVGELCAPKPIAFYLDGQKYTGDPRAIELSDRREIAIVIGTPPAQIPSTADFSRD